MALLVAKESVRAFFLNHNLEKAATLAYYGSLALMPLLLLVIYLLGLFMKSSDAVLEQVTRLMSHFFPSFSDVILQDLMRLAAGQTWGLISLVVLIWSITPFAGAIRSSLSMVFHAERRRNVVLEKLLDLLAVLAVLLLFVFLAGGRVFFSGRTWAGVAQQVPFLEGLRELASPMLTILVLAFFYRVFAGIRLRGGWLLAGAVSSAALLGLIRPLFGLMLRFNPDYGYVFGSLKAIFMLIIWVYYTFAVILFGAEVIAAVRRRNALVLGRLFDGAPGRKGVLSRPLLSRFSRVFAEGEWLFEEGSGGHEMYYVASGAVSILKNGRVVKTMGPGEYLGEMSMLLQAPRTAGAMVSAPDTELIVIEEAHFDTILRENPGIVRSILKEMAERLRQTTGQIPRANHERTADSETPA